MLKSKKAKVIVIIIVVLVTVRLFLPTIVKKVVNKQLANMEEYTGYIKDVDISLIRGAYTIDSIYIIKRESTVDKPFFAAHSVDLSVEWRAIFDGAFVGEFYFDQPQVNFVKSEDESESQYGDDVDWTEPLKELMPIQINHLNISDGSIQFYDYDTKDHISMFMDSLNADFRNLSNASENGELLPSEFNMSAQTIGSGIMSTEGNANFLKPVPDIDYSFKLEGVKLTALNHFFEEYVGVDAEKGSFSLYNELAIKDSVTTGYIKPIIQDLKILSWKNEDENVLGTLKEAGVGLVSMLFRNFKESQTATQVPIEGNITDPDFGSFEAVLKFLENAYIKALETNTNESVDISDIEE